MPAQRHLVDLEQARERTAVRRWLFIYCRELLAYLGLQDGWWCGLFLPRDAVFQDGDQGDVDLLAGPLRYTIRRGDWQRMLRDAERKHGAQAALHYAHEAAAAEGLIEWPPTIGLVAGCEVKVSYFENGRWKRTYKSSSGRREILGQLDYHHRRGVNAVAFLHLAASVPVDRATSGADADLRLLDRAMPSFPMPFEPAQRPSYGYLRSMIAAVADGVEDMHGARQIVVDQWPARANPIASLAWHGSLSARLGMSQRPAFVRTFVVPCEACGAWNSRRDLWVGDSKCAACGQREELV